jgi:hypothetical protein
MRPLLLATLLLLAALAAGAKPTVTQIDPPKSILYIGNSYTFYNNGQHTRLRDLAAASAEVGKLGVVKIMTVSGAYLHDQAAGVPAILASRKWDVVVLQGYSTEPMEGERAEKFRETARAYDKLIRASGARTVFFMTWAYQDKPEMTAKLASGYEAIGNELGALVVPVGLAFERSLKARPALVLHYKDREHPSLAGSYLAACTFYAALFGKSPAGNAETAGLDEETAKFLQGVAWETVKAYYER